MTLALFKGIAIGFLLAMPVGPIGILSIKRTLTEGRRSALSTMLGAASADMIYGAVAVFGVTLVSDLITEHFGPIRIVGGVILLWLGIHTYRSIPGDGSSRRTLNHHAGNFVSTFLLTLTNPLTLIAFAAVFGGMGTVKESAETLTAVLLVAGVFLGSFLWFTCLVGTTYIFRDFLRKSGLGIINKIAGALITAAGVYALLSAVA